MSNLDQTWNMLTSTGSVGSHRSSQPKACQCRRAWKSESVWVSSTSPNRSGPKCQMRRRTWSGAVSRQTHRSASPSTKWSRPSGFRWVIHFSPVFCKTSTFQQWTTVPQTPLATGSVLKEQTEEEKAGLALVLKEGVNSPQNKNFVLKNPKLDSKSALAMRRRSKTNSSNASSLSSSPCDVKGWDNNSTISASNCDSGGAIMTLWNASYCFYRNLLFPCRSFPC